MQRPSNGEHHRIGHVSDFGYIKLNTSTHWSQRAECSVCPVLQLCRGSCMFLEGELWEHSCNNAFADNIAFFAAGIELLTSYAPIYIDGPQQNNRKDIFGLIYPSNKNKSAAPKCKTIPIYPV